MKPRRLRSADAQHLQSTLELIQREFSYMDGVVDPPSSMHRLKIDDLASDHGEMRVVSTPPVASVVMILSQTPSTSASSRLQRQNEATALPGCSLIRPRSGPGSWACPGSNSRPESSWKPITQRSRRLASLRPSEERTRETPSRSRPRFGAQPLRRRPPTHYGTSVVRGNTRRMEGPATECANGRC